MKTTLQRSTLALGLLATVGAGAGCNFFGWVGGGSGLACSDDQACPAVMYCATDKTCQPRAMAGDASGADAAAGDSARADHSRSDGRADGGGSDASVDGSGNDADLGDRGNQDRAGHDALRPEGGRADQSNGDAAIADLVGQDAIHCVDEDGDGHSPYDPGACPTGDDCNDSDPDIHPGAVDLPDDTFDQDCVGGDLHASDTAGLFVDPSAAGADDANNCSMPAPCASIGGALGKVLSTGQRSIFVGRGSYAPLVVSTGVNIFCGYRNGDWTVRDPRRYPAAIDAAGATSALFVATAPDEPVVVDGCELMASGQSGSAMLLVRNSGDLTLTRALLLVPATAGSSSGIAQTNGMLRLLHSEVGGGQSGAVTAVDILGGSAILDGNRIRAGSGTISSTGVRTGNSAVRVELYNNVIHGGRAMGTGGKAVAVDHGAGTLIAVHNTLFAGTAANESSGVAIANAATLVNNIIDAGRSQLDQETAISLSTTASPQVAAVGNLLSCPSSGQLFNIGTINDLNGCAWSGCVEAHHNGTSDPLLVDWDIWPGHLEPASPAIDTAWPTTLGWSARLNRDLDGDPRPLDGDENGVAHADQGADELRGTYVSNGPSCGTIGTRQQPMCSLANAVAYAPPGSAIFVAKVSGFDYSEPLNIGRDLVILGGYANQSWQSASGVRSAVISTSAAPVLSVNTDVRVAVQRFEFATTDADAVAAVAGGGEALFADCRFSGNNNTGNHSTTIALQVTGSARLQRCRVEGPKAMSTSIGLQVDGSGSVTAANTVFLNGDGTALSYGVLSRGTAFLINNYFDLASFPVEVMGLFVGGASTAIINNVFDARAMGSPPTVAVSGVFMDLSAQRWVGALNNLFAGVFSSPGCAMRTSGSGCFTTPLTLDDCVSWAPECTAASGNIIGDPATNSAAAYRIPTTSSSCQNNGIDPQLNLYPPLYDRDIDGEPRPRGGWDIGIDEIL